jgi:lipopolysaccharide export system permease protein
MTLGLYLARRMLGSLGLVLLAFTGVALLFEALEMVRRFGGADTGFAALLWVAALRVPGVIYEILPLLTLLASLALFLSLSRSSELVVMRAAGRPALRILLEPALVALAFGVVAVALINPFASSAYRMHEERVRALSMGDASDTLQLSVGGGAIWLRQGDATGQWLMRADSLAPDGVTFERVSFQRHDAETGAPVQRIQAETARLAEGEWLLSEAKSWELAADNPERNAVASATLSLPTNLTTERIRSIYAGTWTISVWDMPRYIRELDRAGLSTRAHRAQLQVALVLPISILAMMFIGAVLTMGHARAANLAVRILATVLAGFALFFLASFARVLGEVGQLPLIFAIWAPPIAAIMMAVGLVLVQEDG